jgi:hypothetical protein
MLGTLGAAATTAAIAVEPPGVFAFTGLAGIVAFVVAAGCLAADTIPYRPVHAAASGLSLGDAVLLAVGGRATGLPVILPAFALVVLQLAPAAHSRWVSRGARPGFGS